MTLGGSESPDAAVPTFLSERVKQRKLGAFGLSPGGPLLADAVFSSLLSTEEKFIFGQGFSFNSTRASQVWIARVHLSHFKFHVMQN